MNRRTLFLLVGGLVVAAIAAAALAARRTVTLVDNGQSRQVASVGLTAGWVLKDAGVELHDVDEVSPALDDGLPWDGARIEIRRARPVTLWRDGAVLKSWWSNEQAPARLLEAAGVTLASSDRLYWNGAEIPLDQPLPAAGEVFLQIRQPVQTSLTLNGSIKTIASFGPTLGRALWDLGLRLTALDRVSQPLSAPLTASQTLSLTPASPFQVTVDGKVVKGRSAAATVGLALAQDGITLQGLDYAVPAEDQPVPADGRIRVVRVREEIELKQTSIPYTTERVADPNTELDQQSIVQVGQPGVKLARIRVRYEDGKEVARQQEAEWVASQPRNQKTGYGTKIVIRTLDTPDGPIEYWRKVTVYATSYAPCNFIPIIGKCSDTTAAGYPLKKGVIGVGEAWYGLMKGWGVYVDGYGPAKVGDYGYVPGYWVDLGYSDADFVNWHRNTTLYFLTPVPANVPWTLPK